MSIEKNKQCQGDCSSHSGDQMSRRDFLGLVALWSCLGAWFFTFIGLAKFPMPALLPDISRIFKIGKIDDIPIGSQKIFDEKKVLIIRDEKGIRAVSLICTHLGCIVTKLEKGYSCPCHGSKFDEKGMVMAGPAPKGLNWLEVSQLPNGKLVVNADKIVSEQTRFVV